MNGSDVSIESAIESAYFVWPPKNAGTSIHAALSQHGREMLEQPIQKQRYLTPVPVIGFNHWRPKRLLNLGVVTEEEWRRAWSFAVVRNPWDRAVSLYLHHSKKHKFMRFSAWVDLLRRNAVAAAPMRRFPGRSQAAPQTEWTHFDGGEQAVSYIGRYEQLSEAWATICGKIGLDTNPPPPLPWLNRHQAEGIGYRSWYSDALREAVGEFYRSDVEAFGYEF